MGSVIGNHHNFSAVMPEDIVATFTSDPLKACRLDYLFKLSVTNQAESSHAVTSTCQVPTNDDKGSSRTVVWR